MSASLHIIMARWRRQEDGNGNEKTRIKHVRQWLQRRHTAKERPIATQGGKGGALMLPRRRIGGRATTGYRRMETGNGVVVVVVTRRRGGDGKRGSDKEKGQQRERQVGNENPTTATATATAECEPRPYIQNALHKQPSYNIHSIIMSDSRLILGHRSVLCLLHPG